METITLHRDIVPEIIEEISIVAAGLGHAAQSVLFNLAKSGVTKFFLYDFDRIEEGNLPSTFYTVNDIGQLKHQRMGNFLHQISPLKNRQDFLVYSENTKIEGDTRLPIVNFYLNLVDSGNGRIAILKAIETSLEKWREDGQKFPFHQWIIDVRVDFDYFEIYAVNINDEMSFNWYKENTDSIGGKVPERGCGERNFIGTVQMIGGAVLTAILNILNNYYKTMILIKGCSKNRQESWLPPLKKLVIAPRANMDRLI